MIKKISQLDELLTEHDTLDPEKLGHDDLLIEVSLKTRTQDKTNNGYYTSYRTDLTSMKDILGISNLKKLVEEIAEGGLSVITVDFTFGTGESSTKNDRVAGETYRPDNNIGISSYVKFEQDNDFIVRGETNFRNNVTISCDDSKSGNKDYPSLIVDGVATFNKTINGTAYRAQWGDLAETYDADKCYPPGTLVKFGGDREITIAKDKANAVVSKKPGMVLNSSEADKMLVPTQIALTGRVPIRVRGPVKKFDTIVLSMTEPGVGVVYNYALPYEIVGKALEDNDDPSEKLVLCATKLSIR